MIETKDPTHEDYEKIIEQLKSEREALIKRINDLEIENSSLRSKISDIEDHTYIPQEISNMKESTFSSSDTSTKIEEIETISFPRAAVGLNPIKIHESANEPSAGIPIEFKSPTPSLSSINKPIIEGYSRRQCPHCNNDRQIYIQEKIDKTNIIMQYPRLYGKKYVCGKCGGQWKISPTME